MLDAREAAFLGLLKKLSVNTVGGWVLATVFWEHATGLGYYPRDLRPDGRTTLDHLLEHEFLEHNPQYKIEGGVHYGSARLTEKGKQALSDMEVEPKAGDL